MPRPRKLRPQLSAALEELVLTAVAHDAGDRYPTALELASAIERHAATAGEVLGARWIERSLAKVVGQRPVPWITAATAPAAAPVDDGSLVALLAAPEADEPVTPTFGDADEPAAADEPLAPAAAPRGAMASAVPRRGRRVAAGIIALGLVAGSAATALVMTAGSGAPAQPTAPKVTALPATTAPAATTTAPAAPAPAAPRVAPTGPDAAAPAPPADGADAPAPTRDSAPATPPPRKRPRPRPAPRAPNDRPTAPALGDAPLASPPGPGSAVAPPVVAPRSDVEWKPTLLLPTDGSNAKAAR